MTWLSTIGSKLMGLPRLGAKFLRGVGNVGSKVTGQANKFLDSLENTAYIGDLVKQIPMYNTGREVIRSVGLGSDVARQGANVLDEFDKGNYTKAYQDGRKLGSNIEKTYKDQRKKFEDLNYT